MVLVVATVWSPAAAFRFGRRSVTVILDCGEIGAF
jgi:hypothetical protein